MEASCRPCSAFAGCTHFIIGRDMAGSKSSLSGEDFYEPYAAQDTAKAHASELGMQTVPSLNITYTEVTMTAHAEIETMCWSVHVWIQACTMRSEGSLADLGHSDCAKHATQPGGHGTVMTGA